MSFDSRRKSLTNLYNLFIKYACGASLQIDGFVTYIFLHIHTVAIFIGNWCSLSNQIKLSRTFPIHASFTQRGLRSVHRSIFQSISWAFLSFRGRDLFIVLHFSKGALFTFIAHSLFISSENWNDKTKHYFCCTLPCQILYNTFVTFMTLNYGDTLRIDCCHSWHSIHSTLVPSYFDLVLSLDQTYLMVFLYVVLEKFKIWLSDSLFLCFVIQIEECACGFFFLWLNMNRRKSKLINLVQVFLSYLFCAYSMLILQLLRVCHKSVLYFVSHLLSWQYQLYHQTIWTHTHTFPNHFTKWIMKSWNWSRKLNWSYSQKLCIDVFIKLQFLTLYVICSFRNMKSFQHAQTMYAYEFYLTFSTFQFFSLLKCH